jgi:hypothetical protein
VQSESERVQRRAEAEKADLKATISRLEVDLMKVGHLLDPTKRYLIKYFRLTVRGKF